MLPAIWSVLCRVTAEQLNARVTSLAAAEVAARAEADNRQREIDRLRQEMQLLQQAYHKQLAKVGPSQTEQDGRQLAEQLSSLDSKPKANAGGSVLPCTASNSYHASQPAPTDVGAHL